MSDKNKLKAFNKICLHVIVYYLEKKVNTHKKCFIITTLLNFNNTILLMFFNKYLLFDKKLLAVTITFKGLQLTLVS